jgi:GNAT superfamily N-acetyltransferase
MPQERVSALSSDWIVRDQPESACVVIRPFDPECDSMALVEKLLRRASGSCAAEKGHSDHARRRNAVDEQCIVALCGARVAGTITLRGPDPASACVHYRRSDVATVQRYGVDPSLQRRGIGRALLAFANRWAAARGYLQLALDTPVAEQHLLDYYLALGFSLIDTARFAGRDGDSAILSRPTLAGWPCFHTSRATHRWRSGGR